MKSVILLLALVGLAASATSVAQFINDNNALNYALTLENFEAALYESGASFTDAQYTAAGFPVGSKAAIDYIGRIERGHANTITGFLNSRGWPAVQPCTGYTFGYTDVSSFVATLAAVEAVGTGAYDGAAVAISDKTVLTIAAGIATVEARHTALLNVILNAGASGSFSPVVGSAQTNATTFDQTIALVLPFISAANCPQTTLATTYNGSVIVGSLLTSSYRWVSANTLRGRPEGLAQFYATANTTIAANDLAVLQYALALENLEDTFYNMTTQFYTPAAIRAGFAVTEDQSNVISANIALIGAHERLHVAFLQGFLSQYPGVVVGTRCDYDFSSFGVTNFATFLAASATLENTGVNAYVGAISFIANSAAASTAATIATVEGNHAAYVNNLLVSLRNGTLEPRLANAFVPSVGGGALDSPQTPAQILAAIGPIIRLCNATTLGTPAPVSGSVFANFFEDQNQNPLAPFVTATPTMTTNNVVRSTTTTSGNAVVTPTSTPAITSRPATGSAAGLVASAVVVVLALAL